MFPTLTKKSNIIILATTVTVVAIFAVFVMNGKIVPEGSSTGSVTTTTPEAKSLWSSWFSKAPVVAPVKEVVKEPIKPQPPSGTQEVKSKKFWITSDITLLQGEGFFYVEGGVLYKRKDGVAGGGQKVAEGVEWVSGQSEKLTLFTKRAENSESLWDNELWSIDKELGTARKIYEDVDRVSISPAGNMLAISTEGSEIHLVNETGGFLGKVGIHSGYATFSSDGKRLAYHKLADSSPQGDKEDLYLKSQGISVYDVNMGKEFMVTDKPEDYIPAGFSRDGEYLYFISGRNGSNTLWSVNTVVRNNPKEILSKSVDMLNESLWSSDKVSLVLGVEDSISLIRIASDQKSASVHILGQGSSTRWKVQDKTVEFKGKDGEWKTVDVSALVSK